MCSEPGGQYLYHLAIDYKDRKKNVTPAEHLAIPMFEWLTDNSICDTLVVLGADSTNFNTGWKGGVIQYMEKMLGRKVIWLICALHTNELPLRHLMAALDGKTASDNKFDGPIGKLIPRANELVLRENIPPIDTEINLVHLDEDIVGALSADQKYLYEITCALKNNNFPDLLKERKVGPHSHARWLNLASRLCRIWCSEHGLSDADTEKLKLIVQFMVGVYSPMWFHIKVKHSWLEGPRLILKQLSLMRAMGQQVKDIVVPYMRTSAWNAHSEHILDLQTMLSGDNKSLLYSKYGRSVVTMSLVTQATE